MKKVYIVLIVLIVLTLSRLFFISDYQNNTGNSAIVTSPTPLERAMDCGPEIINLYSKNDKSVEKFLIKSQQTKWNGVKYNLVTFNCPDSDKYIFSQVFALTKMSADDSKEQVLFTMNDESILGSYLKDINKDNLAELVISSTNGGNCPNCTGYSVFQIVGDKVNNLLKDFSVSEGDTYPKVWLYDLNGDGIQDIQVKDDSFALQYGFLHYIAPTSTTIYSWKNGEYQDCSDEFVSFYQNQINKRNQNYKTLLTTKKTDLDATTGRIQQLVQIAIENYFDYSSIGKPDMGYDTFVRQIDYENFPKNITVTEEDKSWLESIKRGIEKEYQDSKPTPTTHIGIHQ